MSYKKITQTDNPKHKLIKALAAKGHTGIVLEWNGAMSLRHLVGWKFYSDQKKHYHRLSITIDASLRLVEQMETLNR